MSTSVERVADTLVDAERADAREAAEQKPRRCDRVNRGHVWFETEVQQAHRRLKQGAAAYIREGSLRSLLTVPVIYSLLFPLTLLDAWVTLYQWVCFPIYGIARVRRSEYFVIDRHKLAYLNAIEKVNCTFCSYANGVIAYVREVASCTEQYWCPIKHGGSVPTPHARYDRFFDYGNAEGYHRDLSMLRQRLRPATNSPRRSDNERRGREHPGS